MYKFASKLPRTNDYVIIDWGQSNDIPQGLLTEGVAEEPLLSLAANGTDITIVGTPDATATVQTLAAVDDYTITLGAWVGAEVRMGRPDDPKPGYGTVVSNTGGEIEIDFTTAPLAEPNPQAYITYRDGRNNVYPNVRVLTPYLPDQGGAYPASPPRPVQGLTSSATSYEDLAAFLPFSFMEGVSGYGTSDVGGGGPPASAGATDFVVSHTISTDWYDEELLVGGTLTVVSDSGTSNATIASVSADKKTFNLVNDGGTYWFGGGQPTGGTPGDWTYTLVSGNYSITHATGGGVASGVAEATLTFTQAIPDKVLAGGYVYVEWNAGSTARRVSWSEIGDSTTTTLTGLSWLGDGEPDAAGNITKWEAWIPHYFDSPYAYSPGPGFRYPSNDTTPKIPTRNRARGITGWGWNFNRLGVTLPIAWTLSNTLGVRVNVIHLGISASAIMITHTLSGGPQSGWWDKTVQVDWHPSTTNGLAARLQKMIETAAAANAADGSTKPLKVLALGGFQGEAEAIKEFGRANYKHLLPMFYAWLRKVVHDSGVSYYSTPEQIPVVHADLPTSPWELASPGGGDTDAEVSAAINNFAAKTPFAATFPTDDSPQKTGEEIHFDGAGEVVNGKLMAEQQLALIESVLSAEDDLSSPIVAQICNVALTFIGEKAQITNLSTDLSEQGRRCRLYFPVARELLLQRCSWSFATRRTPLHPVTDARNAEWACAYGYPDNAIRVFSVLPDDAGDDTSISLTSGAITRSAAGQLHEQPAALAYTPQRFTVEQDDDGNRIIYTNVSGAIGRYNVLATDYAQYSPQFKHAMSMQISALLAGTTMRGEDGAFLGQALTSAMERNLGEAKVQDKLQQDIKPQQVVSWMAARKGVGR